jgi:hypothetical protein
VQRYFPLTYLHSFLLVYEILDLIDQFLVAFSLRLYTLQLFLQLLAFLEYILQLIIQSKLLLGQTFLGSKKEATSSNFAILGRLREISLSKDLFSLTGSLVK